jgi:hypothetical protein
VTPLRYLGFIIALAAAYAAMAWLWVSMQYSAQLLGDLARPTYLVVTTLAGGLAWRTWPKALATTWRDRAWSAAVPFTALAVEAGLTAIFA